ncbi:MAG: hypothetical protein QGH60_16340 [Phycisphaerae bacterium]|jgi:hypothetical protein|nr:hypothetical protein [Phycisphaerae bacterium]
MKDCKVSQGLGTPRPPDPPITARIGEPRWNLQAVIDEQLQVIARNDRRIARGWVVIIVQLVTTVFLGLALYLMAT